MEQQPVLQLCRCRAQHVPDTPNHRVRHFRIGATEHHRLGIVEYFFSPCPIASLPSATPGTRTGLVARAVTLHYSSRLLFFLWCDGRCQNPFSRAIRRVMQYRSTELYSSLEKVHRRSLSFGRLRQLQVDGMLSSRGPRCHGFRAWQSALLIFRVSRDHHASGGRSAPTSFSRAI